MLRVLLRFANGTYATLALSLLALAEPCPAQSVVLPAATFSRPQRLWLDINTFWGGPSRSQLIYEVNDIPPVAALWNSLQVRPASSSTLPGTATNAVVVLAVAPNHHSAASTQFANNLGAGAVTVFAGRVDLNPTTSSPTWPAPWQPPILFSVPFAYTKTAGLSLVVDITQTPLNTGNYWFLEQYGVDIGSQVSNPGGSTTCKFSNGRLPGNSYSTLPYVGGSWSVTYQNLLPNVVGFGVLGTLGSGSPWSGYMLPIDLLPFGAPGCSWNVSIDFMVVMVANGSGTATWPSLSIPADPGFGGGRFYDQAIFLDTAANAWGVVTGPSLRWTIGTNRGVPGASVFVVGNNTNPNGFYARETVTTLRLN